MNPVLIAVFVMLTLSLLRLNIIFAIFSGALIGGLCAKLSMTTILTVFAKGLGGGAKIALSYALLGALAMMINYCGLPRYVISRLINQVTQTSRGNILLIVLLALLSMAIASQNVLPIHIAFIPILVPPMLPILSKMRVDRRLISCVLTFGLVATYLSVPMGFGHIYLNEILHKNLSLNGLQLTDRAVLKSMLIPVMGMFIGLLIAIFYSYRKPRSYLIDKIEKPHTFQLDKKKMFCTLLAISLTILIQLRFDSMILGALIGCLSFIITGTIPIKEADNLILQGIKMMAPCGFIMMCAAGLALVMKETGQISALTTTVETWIGGSRGIGALLMLSTGLLVTIGIGSSFSTVPILAALFVPLGMKLGFSPLAIASLVGTAGALGDSGSPASDSTIGPTAGLNADGQHDHVRDSVLPTFIHYNLPLLLFGWIAAMIL